MNKHMKKDLTVFAVVLIMLGILMYAPWPHGEAPAKEPRGEAGEMSSTNDAVHTPDAPALPREATMTVKMNQAGEGLGITITPIEVVEDSRCPTEENIRCIQAGTVRVRVKITNANGERALIFTLGQTVVSKTDAITFTQVLPEARAAVPIVANEYRFIFHVIKTAE